MPINSNFILNLRKVFTSKPLVKCYLSGLSMEYVDKMTEAKIIQKCQCTKYPCLNSLDEQNNIQTYMCDDHNTHECFKSPCDQIAICTNQDKVEFLSCNKVFDICSENISKLLMERKKFLNHRYPGKIGSDKTTSNVNIDTLINLFNTSTFIDLCIITTSIVSIVYIVFVLVKLLLNLINQI